jgi:Zn-dependent protease
MRDVQSWSLSLGRWADCVVRVHAFFIILLVFLLHAATNGIWPAWYPLALGAVLLASLLLHEAAHVLAARRCGGRADQVLIWPLGGLIPASAPADPRAELLVAVAGPLSNLLAAAATLPALLILKRWSVAQLLNPLATPAPLEPIDSAWAYLPPGLALIFWVNWVLFLINLLPASPLDGGRMLRAGLTLFVTQRGGALLASTIVAQLTSFVLIVAAWLLHDSQYAYAWAPLVVLGVMLFFNSRAEATSIGDAYHDDDGLGYDFSQGYTSLERDLDESQPSGLGPVGRWLEERREARQEKQRQIEEDEERRVDDILARLHIAGLAGLSSEDRQILDRVSARYRNRQKR